uniref:Uncharacterized protein n=1 Tax=Parascaris univalens TaxID=6257 RepID=A0A915ALK3_PARUN
YFQKMNERISAYKSDIRSGSTDLHVVSTNRD